MTSSEISSTDFMALIPEEYRQPEQKINLDGFESMQCKWYNERPGNLPDVDCPDCLNRGNFMAIKETGELTLQECKCMIQRRYIRAMRESGLGDMYQRCTFKSFLVDGEYAQDWRIRIKKQAVYYAFKGEDKWLLFSGNSGCGKTHLCTAICSELARQGKAVKYVEWKRLLAKLQQTKYKELENEKLLRDIQSIDVLYLDDFLKTANNGHPTDEALNYALEIINARYIRNKKTILSTEFTSPELTSFDEALGSRIVEKALLIQVARDQGRNFRIK